MNLNNFDTTTGMFRDSSTVELRHSDGQNDLEYSFLDYVFRGTASAVTSAAVGIINTGVAFGEVLGITDADSYIDEVDAVTGLFGEETGEFYEAHQTGIDVLGMVAGSFIPGMAAVKVLRAAQRAGKLPAAAQLRTGLRNPDIILGSKQLQAAKESVLNTRVTGVANSEVRRAYAQGVGQAFMESAAFDIGIVAAMNQNAALNPDDLGYLDAAKNVFIESVPFTFVGGVLGGGLEILKAKGSINKWVQTKWEETGQYHTPPNTVLQGMTPGDKFVSTAQDIINHQALRESMDTNDAIVVRSFEQGENILKQRILDIAEEAGVRGKDQLAAIENIMNAASESGDVANVANILSGLTKVDNLTNTDFTELHTYYDKVLGPSAVIQGSNFEDVARQIYSRQSDFQDAIRQLGMDEYAESMNPLKYQVALRNSGGVPNSQGFATPQVTNTLDTSGPEEVINLNLVKSHERGADHYFVPGYASTNMESISKSYEVNKAYWQGLGEEFTQTFEEYTQRVLLHEMGHVKANDYKLVTLVQNSLDLGTNREMLGELISASIKSRRLGWASKIPDGARMSERELIDSTLTWLESPNWNNPPEWTKYYGTPKELLADGASYMVREDTRQVAAKSFPKLAELFNANGGIAKAWDDTKAYYNTASGKVVTSALPGINDLSRLAKVRNTKQGEVLEVPEMKRTFTRNAKIFDGDVPRRVAEEGVDVLDFDAQWNIVARKKLQDLLPKSGTGTYTFNDTDLPVMEKIVTELRRDPKLIEQYKGKFIRQDGSPIESMADVSRLYKDLWRAKKELRDSLITVQTAPYINEHKLSKMLNTSIEFAQGTDSAKAMLYGSKNFESPELIKVSYKHKTPEDYKGAAISMQGYQYRNNFIQEQNQRIAAELLGNANGAFTEVPWEKLYTISPVSQRTSLTANLRSEFGGFREWAQYIGKQTTKALSAIVQRTDEQFVAPMETFNKAGNTGLRYELAQIDNMTKRNWYYHGTYTNDAGETVNVLASKDKVHEAINDLKATMGEAGESLEFDPSMLEDMDSYFVDFLRGNKVNGDSAFVELSDEVGTFVREHINRNRGIVYKKRRLAEARGYEAVYDENVFYPPPRDLRQSKFHAFVTPTAAMRGSDTRQYMVFAETESEFNAKVGLIEEKYGDKYRVVTQSQVTQYKTLLGEYDKDLVFDEMFFDSSLARMGKSSELFPNADLMNSGTVERYREWTIRQEEAIFRGAVETKYSDMMGSLRELDNHYNSVGRTSLDKKYKQQDSIWKDTINVMLGTRGYGSKAEQMFVRINDFIGDIGSQALDNAINALRPGRNTSHITDEMMEGFNRQLEEQGLIAPTRNAIEAITTSPNVSGSRTLNQLVRTLSNLTSLSMLRMDWAHSFIQLVSTPILAGPVLQELQTSVRGTEAGTRLRNMTTVVNPATGLAEPTPMKLYMEGTQKFFTEEGRGFIQQLRDRNIISDYLIQYLDTMDFSAFNGSHTLQQISAKVDQFGDHVSKWSLFTQSEEFTRFQVAWAAKRMGEIAGKPPEDLWPMISSTVDKVHGVYIGNQRPQFFQGVLGQAIGLYQTYFFNFMQNMMKYYGGGENKQLLTLGAMQSGIFGIQSWPGFDQLNTLIGETNTGRLDLFNVTNADDPNSLAAYFMYGLGSHSLGVPIDFYSRGDLDIRHPTVLPTNPWDFPVVSTLAKAVGNIYNTGKLAVSGDVPLGEALLHGMAHNGLNRPLQGLGQILRNRVTSNNGQVNFDNVAYTGDSIWNAEDVHWGSMFARIIGSKPLDESIILNAYYRDAAYQANIRRETTSLGKKIQLNVASGELNPLSYGEFRRQYEATGADVQNFNAYWSRQLQNAQKPVMEEFKRDLLQGDGYNRMLMEQSITPPWQN